MFTTKTTCFELLCHYNIICIKIRKGYSKDNFYNFLCYTINGVNM